MARHKDVDWNLGEGEKNSHGGTSHSHGQIHCALLMDIRDELKSLNNLLHCANFVNMPRSLKAIERNTEKKTKKIAGGR